MPLRLRRFRLQDRALVEALAGPARSCLQTLFDRNYPLHVAELTYGAKVWEDRALRVSDPPVAFKQPIGLVAHGVLEVTERFFCGEIERRRTTAILGPGQFFGLFEALGGLRGFWDICAGVQGFLITNRLGNVVTLRQNGWRDVSEPQLRTLQHRVEARFDYSDLIRFALAEASCDTPSAASAWNCTIILFDLEPLTDSEVLIDVLRAGVVQLASWARQNPPDALFEESPRAKDTADHLRVAATLDAILTDHIPIFCAHAGAHEAYGPFKRLSETLRSLTKQALGKGKIGSERGSGIHLWIPDYWSRVNEPGALYVDALTRKFDMTCADELLKVGAAGRVLRSGTKIQAVRSSPGERYTVRVTTNGGEEAIIHRLAVRRGAERIPRVLQDALFPAGTPTEFKYGWPSHLGSGFFLQPIHERT